jgi:hypothetical protein
MASARGLLRMLTIYKGSAERYESMVINTKWRVLTHSLYMPTCQDRKKAAPGPLMNPNRVSV